MRSPVGRAKTLPERGREGPVRFASAGCQWYEEGFFTAWRRIAEERLDFVIHYGDYIYEYAARKPDSRRNVPTVRDMPGAPGKCLTLADYRQRYAIYKLDPDLQAAHASAPFVMSFDDHEVENNWAGYASAYEGTTREAFALRRAAAFQAWYEHMPLRRAQMPRGPEILAHQRYRVGDLMQIEVLDTRQHRDPQPCGDGWKACPEAKAAHRTMLGKVQEQWLADGLKGNRAQWNVLAQQVPFARLDRNPDPAITETDMDKWDGAEPRAAAFSRWRRRRGSPISWCSRAMCITIAHWRSNAISMIPARNPAGWSLSPPPSARRGMARTRPRMAGDFWPSIPISNSTTRSAAMCATWSIPAAGRRITGCWIT